MKISHILSISKVIAAVAILVLAISSKKNIDDITEARTWVDHTLKVIIEKEVMDSTIKELESKTRGYAATGDERFLDGSGELRQKIQTGLITLRQLSVDNPRQQANVAALVPLVSRRLQHLDKLTLEVRNHGPAEARKLIRLPENGTVWEWMRVSQRIKDEEEGLVPSLVEKFGDPLQD